MDTKVCTKCGEEKSLSCFGLRKDRNYRPCSACKKCNSLAADMWNKKNPEKFLKNANSYYYNNRDKILAKPGRREKNNIRKKSWRKNNLWLDAKRSCERRRMVKQAKPGWANDRYIELFYIIAQLEREETGLNFHVDHIVPLKSKLVCGLHVEWNLQILSAKENLQKHNSYWPDMP